MNKLLAVHDCIGYVFGAALLAGGIYFGTTKIVEYRREMHKQAQAWVDKELTDPKYSMPGMTGEYPQDGPLADFYRNQGKFEIAPVTNWSGYPNGNK